MLTSVANNSSLSSMLATVTSPWLTKGKSKGLVEIRSKSVKEEDPLTPQAALSQILFPKLFRKLRAASPELTN